MQDEARKRGHEVRWLLVADASPALLTANEVSVSNVAEAVRYNPDAVFAPGDRVPGFIPGLKIQVFHGINEDKRGNIYPERGLFDLYCTEGPARTAMLAPLAKERGYFRVVETGWLKLDTILNQPDGANYDRPQIMFASTFTPRLSGAADLYPEIAELAKSGEWQWLVTLHPKMAAETAAKYRALEDDNLKFFGTDAVPALLKRADVMVCDNSSILQEFLLLGKPVVTYRNRDPQTCMINISEPAELKPAVRRALAPDAQLQSAIDAYGPSLTPFLDGASAARVLAATEEMLDAGWQDRKPMNMWRNLKMRRQLGYFRP